MGLQKRIACNRISACKIGKGVSFTHFNKKKKNTHISACIVTVALHLIFYYFFLSPSPHSLFFSLVLPLSPLSLFISGPSFSPHWSSKQATTDLWSKLCHWSPKQAHSRRATKDRRQSKLTRQSVLGFSVWSMGFGVLTRHGKKGQNFLARLDLTQKIPYPNLIFSTRSKNGLTRDPTRVFCGSTQPNPNPNHFFKKKIG